LSLRRPERCTAWQAFLEGEGEQPTLPERPVPESNILDDDINGEESIDQELGFLD
jgi:hypothetical protein